MFDNELLNSLTRKMVANPKNYMESFRSNLFVYIDNRKITLSEIAEEAGISVETLKTLVYGKGTDCKLSTAVALARALHISVDELVGAGTLTPTMCESISIVRNLPENFVYFVRWVIRFNERMLAEHEVTEKAINVMLPECCHDGNLRMTTDFDVLDVSDMPNDKRHKVFMGLQIPCEHYMPSFAPSDVLVLANDRRPLQGEVVVIVNNGFIRIGKWHEEKQPDGSKLVSILTVKRNSLMAYLSEVDEIIGYVVEIRH